VGDAAQQHGLGGQGQWWGVCESRAAGGGAERARGVHIGDGLGDGVIGALESA
jgi:hypothetical protein